MVAHGQAGGKTKRRIYLRVLRHFSHMLIAEGSDHQWLNPQGRAMLLASPRSTGAEAEKIHVPRECSPGADRKHLEPRVLTLLCN